jgi:tetratricopeptide (TPR) repeat protein
MKKIIYWWAMLSPLMKLALLVGVLWLLIVAGSVVSFYLLPQEWQGLIVIVSTALTASVTLLAALLSSREKLPGPKIRPAKEGELLIVVARFRGPESPDPQMYIARRLEADLLMHPALADRVRVSRFPMVIEEESPEAEIERARTLGQTYRATLVIWGEHDGHSAAPHYLVTRERERVSTFIELEPRAATADLNQFVMYVSEELPETMTYLSFFTIGRMYYSTDKYSHALSLFSAALDHFPSGEVYQESAVTLRFYRGTTDLHLGKYDLAIADYDRAIELRHDYAGAYNNRGIAYADKGEYDLAIADYDKAIELKPDCAEAYNNRGSAYDQKGEYDLAIADYGKAIELRPDYVKAYNNRGFAYVHKDEYDLAIGDYDNAIELKPNYATAYYNRGNAYYGKGEYDLAIADFDRAIELKPDLAGAYYNRGFVHQIRGKKEESIKDFERFLELSEDEYWRKEAEKQLRELRGQ